MQHLITLDLDEVPQVRSVPGLADMRALAVFISDADDNVAWEPGTDETAVLALTEQDSRPRRVGRAGCVRPATPVFDLQAPDVPLRAFADDLDEGRPDRTLYELPLELMSTGRGGLSGRALVR